MQIMKWFWEPYQRVLYGENIRTFGGIGIGANGWRLAIFPDQ